MNERRPTAASELVTVESELLESAVDPDPVVQFRRWFEDARETDHPLPEGVALATVGEGGRPSLRVVLLKGFDERGARFFTNYDSRKARELAGNANAALLFWWPSLQRQVRLEGAVARLSAEDSDAYHASRPRGSQIGAWASQQSHPVADRGAVQRAFEQMEARFAGREVPRPPGWGGFLLCPDRYEFWQGRDNRLHDRLVYSRAPALSDRDPWTITRLAP